MILKYQEHIRQIVRCLIDQRSGQYPVKIAELSLHAKIRIRLFRPGGLHIFGRKRPVTLHGQHIFRLPIGDLHAFSGKIRHRIHIGGAIISRIAHRHEIIVLIHINAVRRVIRRPDRKIYLLILHARHQIDLPHIIDKGRIKPGAAAHDKYDPGKQDRQNTHTAPDIFSSVKFFQYKVNHRPCQNHIDGQHYRISAGLRNMFHADALQLTGNDPVIVPGVRYRGIRFLQLLPGKAVLQKHLSHQIGTGYLVLSHGQPLGVGHDPSLSVRFDLRCQVCHVCSLLSAALHQHTAVSHPAFDGFLLLCAQPVCVKILHQEQIQHIQPGPGILQCGLIQQHRCQTDRRIGRRAQAVQILHACRIICQHPRQKLSGGGAH